MEVIIPDGEDDDVPPQLHHCLDEVAYNSRSMNDDTGEMSIPELTANLNRQKKTGGRTPYSLGSECDMISVNPGNFYSLKKIVFKVRNY